MNWSSISKCLYEFEKAHGKELTRLKFDGFNAWQIVKVPLYFNSINASGSDSGGTVNQHSVKRLLRKISNLASLASGLASLSLRSRGRRPVLFYTYSGDKLARDEKGYYFNFLTDGFILNELVPDYVYAETSFRGQFKQPSRVRVDFKMDDLFVLFTFFRKRARKKVSQAKDDIDTLYDKLNMFMSRNNCFATGKDVIENIFHSFDAERSMFSLFLNMCRPRMIITSETPGTAFLAAAKEKKIPVLDLQHGLIDIHHPQYVYAGEMETFKQGMILPQWVGLFGNFHKQSLLNTGFWKENELVVLGSSRMEMNREKYANKGDVRPFILVPAQWTYFTQTKIFLETVLPALPANYKIVLKLHPLEKDELVNAYHKIQGEAPLGKLEIAGKNDDIYPLIGAARLVIGFDSAVLLEALSLGAPCITLCTNERPKGIHSLFTNSRLETSIKPVHYTAENELLSLIHEGLSNENYYAEWKGHVQNDAEDLFAKNYTENCARFIREHLQLA